MNNFKIEQIAIHPRDPKAAIKLLTEMGAADWARDHVVASGAVFGHGGKNEADLAFNYDMGVADKALEFEVLNYTDGPNWVRDSCNGQRSGTVCHLGMHVTPEELVGWRHFFAQRGIQVAQEVMTESHTNPAIKDQRWYNYVIFDTKAILGVDVKFIVRRPFAPQGA